MSRLDVLVTGSSGQVGSGAVEHFRSKGLRVAGLDLRPAPTTDTVADARSAKLDPARVIIHCAAQVSVVLSIEAPEEDASHNVLGTVHALDEARRMDAEAFIFFSSAAVYGTPVSLPIREDHPLAPLSPYGASKVAGEQYVRLFARQHGLRAAILRPFNIFSRRQDPSSPYAGVFARFAGRVKAGEPPQVRGDGSQTRDFIHLDDVLRVVEMVIQAADASATVYNVGTGLETSVLELARLFVEEAGLKEEPERVPAVIGEIHRSVADIGRVRELGFVPATDVRQGVRTILR